MKLRERAYQRFTQQLLAKKIRPGQFLSQRELMALTGLTLGPVRELIPRLEAERLIVTIPQRGMQIAHLDVHLVRNAFQLRSILELEAIRHFVRVATDAEIDALAADLDEVKRRAESERITPALLDRAQAVDWSFHDALIDSLGNEIVSSIYRVNSIRIRLIRLERVVLSSEVLLPALREHGEIIARLQARDAPGAEEALRLHLASAQNRATGLLVVPVATPPARTVTRPQARRRKTR
jgi:DNA-binding GntR family transcriptional regulator